MGSCKGAAYIGYTLALERSWQAVPATPLTLDGNQFGVVTIADTAGFYSKQIVFLVATAQNQSQLQVKRVISPTQLIVGPINDKVQANNFTDIRQFTVALGAMIGAAEQSKNNIPEKDHYSAVYEADPIIADRVILVDEYGRHYREGNPLPIAFDGTIAIGNVEVKGSTGNTLEPNPDGSLNVVIIPSTSGNDKVRNTFGVASAVASGATTTIVTYTVPSNKNGILERAVASGENIATYTLAINGITQSVLRTYFFSSFNVSFEFTTGQDNGFILNAGDVVTITVLHTRPSTANFDGRIQVFEIAQ